MFLRTIESCTKLILVKFFQPDIDIAKFPAISWSNFKELSQISKSNPFQQYTSSNRTTPTLCNFTHKFSSHLQHTIRGHSPELLLQTLLLCLQDEHPRSQHSSHSDNFSSGFFPAICSRCNALDSSRSVSLSVSCCDASAFRFFLDSISRA